MAVALQYCNWLPSKLLYSTVQSVLCIIPVWACFDIPGKFYRARDHDDTAPLCPAIAQESVIILSSRTNSSLLRLRPYVSLFPHYRHIIKLPTNYQ